MKFELDKALLLSPIGKIIFGGLAFLTVTGFIFSLHILPSRPFLPDKVNGFVMPIPSGNGGAKVCHGSGGIGLLRAV